MNFDWSHITESPMVVIGIGAAIALYTGKLVQKVRLPSIIGFMLLGVLLGPPMLHLLNTPMLDQLYFIDDIALGFVALAIGLELSFSSLREQGKAIIYIILAESFFTAIVVTVAVGLLTGNWPFALLLGAIAPASAPAGTVAIIREYRAKGPLTRAMYAVVGFDDGLGIIIFGFASAIAVQMLSPDAFSWNILFQPLLEIVGSLVLGLVIGLLTGILVSRLKVIQDIFVLVFGIVLFTSGLSNVLHLSLILTNLAVGIVLVNSQPRHIKDRIEESNAAVMPLLFTLFFFLAGAHLDLRALPALGLIGIVYIVGRSFGLISGAWIGSYIGGAGKTIRNNLGLGILSQAGVAIGLALYVQRNFSGYGENGAWIGTTIITMVTATSIIFEIIGPILTKVALRRAGEIPED